MKKRVLAALLAAGMLASFVACGGNSSSTTPDAPAGDSNDASQATAEPDAEPDAGEEAGEAGAADGEEANIRFMWWGGDERTEATLAVIDQFMELYPNIKIEAEYASSDGYHDKLATQLASGTAADIVQVDPETMPTYVNADADYFLDYLDYDFDFSNFSPDFINKQINGNYSGHQYGIPTGIAGPALLVNQDLADEFNIDFSSQYTWDDMIEWGKQVHAENPDVYLICANKEYVTNLVTYIYLKQITGTTIFDVDSKTLNATEEDMEKVFELVQSLYDNDIVAPASYTAAYAEDNLPNDPNWINGNYVATFTYISTMDVMTAANPDANYSVGYMPVVDGSLDAGWTGNCPQILAVTATSQYPEAAMLFLDYFFNNETAMSTLACVRSVPPTERAREICAADGTLNDLMMEGANIVDSYNGITPDQYASSQEAKQIMANTVEEVGYGASSPAAAAQDFINQMQSYIDAQ